MRNKDDEKGEKKENVLMFYILNTVREFTFQTIIYALNMFFI